MASIPVQGTPSSFFKAWRADRELSKLTALGPPHPGCATLGRPSLGCSRGLVQTLLSETSTLS